MDSSIFSMRQNKFVIRYNIDTIHAYTSSPIFMYKALLFLALFLTPHLIHAGWLVSSEIKIKKPTLTTETITLRGEEKLCEKGKTKLCPEQYNTKTKKWSIFTGSIQGFNYLSGYTYTLSVKKDTSKNPPVYSLKRIIQKKEIPINLAQSSWTIVSLNGKKITSPGTITFSGKHLSGKLCNTFSGDFKYTKTTIDTVLIRTEMFCQTDNMKVEDRMQLKNASYKIQKWLLTIRTRKWDVIIWKKQ